MEVPFQIGFATLGTIIYNELAVSLGAEIDDRGYVITDSHGETAMAGLFAAGDLRANKKKQIYTAWDIAVDSVDRVDSYIRKEKRQHWLENCDDLPDQVEKYGARMG